MITAERWCPKCRHWINTAAWRTHLTPHELADAVQKYVEQHHSGVAPVDRDRMTAVDTAERESGELASTRGAGK